MTNCSKLGPIGGYPSFEGRPYFQKPHSEARIALKSGRSCVRFLIEHEKPLKIWLPYYCCDALLEPIIEANIEYEFYEITEQFECGELPDSIGDNERLIYVNYFGLKSKYVEYLEQNYGGRLWIDNVQAFYYIPKTCQSWQFNSIRKFFGVPDGAFLYGPLENMSNLYKDIPRNIDYRIEHLLLRHLNKAEDGYRLFKENEQIVGEGLERMSLLTEVLIDYIDFHSAAIKRRDNYLYLHEKLGKLNILLDELIVIDEETVPFYYPFLPSMFMRKEGFWKQGIYIPEFWKECMDRLQAGYRWEKRLSSGLMLLPIDHRYNFDDMDRLIESIKKYEK